MTNDELISASWISSFEFRHSLVIRISSFVIFAMALAIAGCSHPSEANIQLRRDKQQLEGQVAELQQQLQTARARITGIEQEKGTLPSLPQERLDRMVTVHGIKLGRLTGGDPANIANAPDEGLKIYLTPVDETGEPLKSTGTVEVDAFDLTLGTDNRIGHWSFDANAMKPRWRSLAMLRAFVLECPWQKQPAHSKLAVKVTFHDELTGRVYDQIQEVNVKVPTTQPTTRTANR